MLFALRRVALGCCLRRPGSSVGLPAGLVRYALCAVSIGVCTAL
jgi:hypothetical protein